MDIERVVLMLFFAVVLTTLTVVLVPLMSSGFGAAKRWIRHRRSLLVQGESMFVGRWGREGPELFVVGSGARPLLARTGKGNVTRRELGEVGLVLAERILLEILARRPSRELAWAFAEERLGTLPVEGFVLPTSEVITWLDAREAGGPRLGSRVAELAGAGGGVRCRDLAAVYACDLRDPLPTGRGVARGHGRDSRVEPPRS